MFKAIKDVVYAIFGKRIGRTGIQIFLFHYFLRVAILIGCIIYLLTH